MSGAAHRLSQDQFDAVAAGGGDAETIAALRRAQVSKRLLLLREVRVATALGDEPAWALIDAAMERRPEAAREVLSRPLVDVWASRTLRGAGPPDARYLTGLAAATAVAAGVDFECRLPHGDGGPLLPGLGMAVGPVGSAVTLANDGSILRVETSAGSVRVAPGTAQDQEHWYALRAVEPYGIEIDDLDPYRDCFGLPTTGRLTAAAAARLAGLVGEALSLVDSGFAGHTATVRGCVGAIVPLVGSAERSISASSQSAFGAVAVGGAHDAAELALLLVHEAAHAKLGALLDLVDLVEPSDVDVFRAPWRLDPRPASALLQGTFAHAAVADFWRIRRAHLAGEAARRAEFEYHFWRTQVRDAAATLADSRALTPLGERFVARLAEAVDRWPDDAPPAIRSAVSAGTAVTSVEWGLRNHRPPAGQASELSAAFARGRRCPPVPSAAVVAGGPGGAAMSSGLARAIRDRAVGGAAASPAVSSAGSPVFSSAVGEPVDALDRRLSADPDDVRAWALLALALAEAGSPDAARVVRERPELVRALISPERPAASAVAAWLAAGIRQAVAP